MTLPPENPPFPIKDVFRVRADLYRLGTVIDGRREDLHFVADDRFFDYVEQKLNLLETDPDLRRLIDQNDRPGLTAALRRVFEQVGRDQPEIVQADGDGFTLLPFGIRVGMDGRIDRLNPTPLGARIADWLEGQEGVTRLADALALTCQEDIVVMRGDGAELLHVCFPSHWDIREKFQYGFARIHEPVARNEALIKAAPNVMQAIVHKGPFVRFGWSLTLTPALDQHPEKVSDQVTEGLLDDPAELVKTTYLRMERQTTAPMADLDRGLFTIRVSVQPLAEAINSPERRERFANILRTLEPEVAVYKGITELREPLLAWLDAL